MLTRYRKWKKRKRAHTWWEKQPTADRRAMLKAHEKRERKLDRNQATELP